MQLLFVTSNSHKIESANKNLKPYGIEIEAVQVSDINEIQSDSIEDISIDKAKKAYKQIQKPLMVSDAGWSIPSLNGFPGPVMAYVHKCFTSKDFLNLMEEKKDKSVELIECMTYIDEDGYRVFKNITKGRFLDHEEGEGGCLDKVVSFRKDGKSVAKCRNDNIVHIDQSDMWEELGEYLSNKN
jgi:XTP/dITP diphosphohydrolase